MDALIKPIEMALLPLFRSLPALPENSKKALVKYWPVLALVFGVLQLVGVYGLWQLGHTVNLWTDYANQLSVTAGNGPTPQLGIFYYLGLASLAIDGVLLLLAYGPLKEQSKKGWDLLFLGTLFNVAYGVFIVFDGYYGTVSNLVGALIGSAIGFYILYQVRDYYSGSKVAAGSSALPDKPKTKK